MLASGVVVWKPTLDELEAAKKRKLPDLIQPGLRVLFCGINPGLYSAATAHHFARPGNRFWPTLHASGFTPRLIHPFEERELLTLRLGITNLASRTTATADELEAQELVRGAAVLTRKVKKYRPEVLGMVGLTAYRTAFRDPKAKVGLQDRKIGSTEIWLLPNPSGLNAHHQPADLARLFGELRSYVAVR